MHTVFCTCYLETLEGHSALLAQSSLQALLAVSALHAHNTLRAHRALQELLAWLC